MKLSRALLPLAIAGAPSAQVLEVLQPKTYRSPNGIHALTVQPNERFGRGRGHYRLTSGGLEVWSDTLPFTLWEATVDDCGLAAGYGYTAGAYSPFGEFVVATIRAQVGATVADRIRRRGSRYLHDSPYPWAKGVLLSHEADALVVRMSRDRSVDPEQRETWRVYRASIGALLGECDPWQDDVDVARDSLSARAVPGTPLIVSEWRRYKYLSEPVLRQFLVSSLEEPLTFSVGPSRLLGVGSLGGCALSRIQILPSANEPMEYSRSRSETVRCDWESEFCLGEQGDWKCLRVSRSSGTWTVHPTGRKLGETEPAPAPPHIPVLELPFLGEQELVPRLPSASAEPVGAVFVDAKGGVYLCRGEVLQAYDRSGRFVYERSIAEAQAIGGRPNWSGVREDGTVFVAGKKLLELTLDGGTRVSRSDSIRTVHFVPGGRWVLGPWDILRIGSDGERGPRINRTPANEWFEGGLFMGSRSDGALAVVEWVWNEARRNKVHLYTPEGDPVATHPLHSEASWPFGVAYGRHWLAVSVKGGVRLMTPDGERSMRCPLPAASFVFLSPDESELWTFPVREPRKQRWRMPDP